MSKNIKIYNKGEIIVNTYEVLELINSGGMGNVYKVKHNKIEKILALKQLKILDYITDKRILIEGFISEVSILTSLRHPNIAKYYDSFFHNDDFFYVMEYINGFNIKEFFIHNDLKENKEELVINFLFQALEALDYIHQKNIIHRDLKPSNLLITDKNILKMIDFGISKSIRKDIIFTTPGYSPPEQTSNIESIPTNDIFSLGITFIELLTNLKPPANIKENKEYSNYIKTCNDKLKLNISNSLIEILNKMIEYDYKKRYQSVSEIKKDLQKNGFKFDNNYITNFYLKVQRISEIFDLIENNLNNNLKKISLMGEISLKKTIDIMECTIYNGSNLKIIFDIKEEKDDEYLYIYLIKQFFKPSILAKTKLQDFNEFFINDVIDKVGGEVNIL
ncbi:MAG: serine/threonine-protein kinase [bacterium]|jgi:serine/threonine-protein kinase